MPHVQDILKRADEATIRIAKEIPPEDARVWIDLGALIIDVRDEQEFAAGRIPGAIRVGLDRLESSIEAVAPLKSMPVLLYCSLGFRSARAADALQRLGYASVASLAGGLKAYTEAFNAREIT